MGQKSGSLLSMDQDVGWTTFPSQAQGPSPSSHRLFAKTHSSRLAEWGPCPVDGCEPTVSPGPQVWSRGLLISCQPLKAARGPAPGCCEPGMVPWGRNWLSFSSTESNLLMSTILSHSQVSLTCRVRGSYPVVQQSVGPWHGCGIWLLPE